MQLRAIVHSFFFVHAITGGASDDFAKARAMVPYAVTVELPPDKYVVYIF